MTTPDTEPAEPKPERHWLQFSLRTLLLLFVLLGASLAVFGEAAIVVCSIALGLALFVNRVRSLSRNHLYAVAYCLIGLFGLWWLLPQIGAPREAGRRSACINRLQHIARALRNYHQANGCYPPAYIADKNGKPLHSWRTLLLPYLGYDDVYKRLDLTEPWDSPKNSQVLAFHPREFFCFCDPSSRTPGSMQANYLAVVGPNAAWTDAKSKKWADFGPNASSTIMLIEVAESGIKWAEPKDFSLDTLVAAGNNAATLPVFSRHGREEGFFLVEDRRSGVCVLTANGDVQYLPTEVLSPESLRKLLQFGGCKLGEIDSLADRHYDESRSLNWPNIAALAVWLLAVGTLLTHAVRSRTRLSVLPSPQPAGSSSGPRVE